MKIIFAFLILISSAALADSTTNKETASKEPEKNVFQKIGHDIKAVGKDIGEETSKVASKVSSDTKVATTDAKDTGTGIGHKFKNFFHDTGTAFKNFFHKTPSEEPKKQ